MRGPALLAVAAAVGLWLPSSLTATPIGVPSPCVAGTLASYEALGAVGCTIGTEIGVRDFDFNVLQLVNTAGLTSADIFVTPMLVGLDHLLIFTAPVLGFSVQNGEREVYSIAYNIDPHPIILSFTDDMETFTPTGNGFARVDTSLCVGAPFTPACAGTPASLAVFHNGANPPPPQLIDTVSFSPLVADLGVNHVITLDALRGGSADFATFTASNAIVPEPGTLAVVGLGLVVLWRRRRMR